MNKEIGYTGVSNVPSDYDVQDGQLTAAVNMINEGRGMEAVFPPKETDISLEKGQRLVYIHSNSNFKHFILGDNNALYWLEEGREPVQFTTDIDADHIASITSIGNTLVVSATGYTGEKEENNGLNYYLWTDKTYKFLGMDVPDIPIWWHLYNSGTSNSTKTWADIPSESMNNDFTNYVFAAINPLVQEAKEDNKFVMPFFIRYAIRLFDGTLVKHSAPILMVPTTLVYPYTAIDTSKWPSRGNSSPTTYTTGFTGYIIRTSLFYYIRKDALNLLAEWKDIISSIDIFVSDQIYTYDTNWKHVSGTSGRVVDRQSITITPGRGTRSGDNNSSDINTRAEDNDTSDINILSVPAFGIYKNGYTSRGHQTPDNEPLTSKYVQKWEQIPGGASDSHRASVYAPGRSTKLYKNIREESHFYLAASMEVKDFKGNEWTELVMDDGTLSSITAHEAMTDDYNTHDRLYPKNMFVYNNRLNLTGLSRKIYKGYEPTTILPFINGHVTTNSDGTLTDDSEKCIFKIVVFIKEDGAEYVAFGDLSYSLDASVFPVYLYYPNVNAYKMVIWRHAVDGEQVYYNIPLTKHEFLNGAYWFNDFKEPTPELSPITLPTTYGTIIPMANQIYTSAVNNPFSFPVANILEVGTGEILSLSTSTKPVSTGQFGEYPLYVFTTEGIWALQVGSDGIFVAKQPISRDVCNNPASITQIDNAVLFSTERGIMMAQGGSTTAITDILDGPAFDFTTLPHFDQLLKNAALTMDNVPSVRFNDYIKGCSIAYDYIHQKLHLFNPAHSYEYVFAFKTKQWGMAVCDFRKCIQSYPDTYMVTKANRILSLSVLDYSKPVNGMIVTRPLKFQANDILKTLTTSIHRGKFNKGDVRGAIYGSRDLIHWYLVGSSVDHYFRNFHGTGFKYFRFVINATFERDESLSGTSVDFTPKENNKLR